MTLSLRHSNPQPKAQKGFSLIELMVAIAIMAILVGIIGGALFRMGTVARVRATQTTIQKIDAVLKQRQKAVARTAVAQASTTSLTNMTGENVRAYKEEFRRWFPQLPGIDSLPGEGGLDSTKYNLPGEILYAMVSKGVTIGSDEVQGADFNSSELADVDNDGLPEIIDAWGNPILFYRWPTRLIRPDGALNPANPQGYLSLFMVNVPTSDLLAKDPDNPLDLDLRFKSRSGSPMSISELERYYHTMVHRTTSGTPDMNGTYHMLLLVSAGPDGDSGLIPLVDSDNNGVYSSAEMDTNYRDLGGHLAQPRAEVMTDPFNSVMNDNITNLNIEVK